MSDFWEGLLCMQVSVVIPWHGDDAHLERAIRSVLRQSMPAAEIIVVCNGPAATQADAIKRLYGSQVTTISTPEPNANIARNAGIDHCSSEYIAFLDADDEFRPIRIEKSLSILRAQTSPSLMCGAGIRTVSADQTWVFANEEMKDDVGIGEHIIVKGNLTLTSSIVCHSDVARGVRFDPTVRKFQDLDFLLRAESQNFKLVFVTEPLFIYHDEQSEGRLSRGTSFRQHIDWAASHEDIDKQLRAAFEARFVAQHEFPRNFFTNLMRLFKGRFVGKIPTWEISAMAMRGLIPPSLRDPLLHLYGKTKFVKK